MGFFWVAGSGRLQVRSLESPCLCPVWHWRDRPRRGVIGRFLVVPLARYGGAEIDHFVGVFVDQQNVLVAMGLFLAALMASSS